jgi:isocitrate/isopropylmalate dehydrogenase
MGAILTAALMLEDLGEEDASRRVEAAITSCLRAGKTTVDLGGDLGCQAVGDAICAEL